MEPVRVALVGLPALLDGVVRALLDGEADLSVVAAGHAADVVVCPAGEAVSLMTARRPARLVIIAPDGRTAYLCAPSGELSPASLRSAIRGG